MKRLEELISKFPEIPRTIVIKVDLLKRGLKYTPILREVAEWAAPATYSIYDLDHEYWHTRDDVAKDDVGKGWVKVPCEFRFPDDTTIGTIIDSKSPYEIRRGTGKYVLSLEETPIIDEIIFPPRPKWYTKKTSNNTLMCSVGFQFGDCLMFVTINHCEYFKTGDACVFCCLNPTTARSRDLGIDRKIVRNIEDFIETYSEASKEAAHMNLSGGGLIDRKQEAGRYVQMLSALRDGGYRPRPAEWTVSPQALEEEDARRLYDLGAEVICYPMEVWQENMWPIICPGKSKFVGRDRWINSLIKAVEIFGRGNVKAQFVGGCEMAPPHGFKDIDEAVKSTLDGFEWLAQRGIISQFTQWTNTPGSKFENVEPPPAEYYLKLGYGLHKVLLKYDLSWPKNMCHKCSPMATRYDFPRLLGEPTNAVKSLAKGVSPLKSRVEEE